MSISQYRDRGSVATRAFLVLLAILLAGCAEGGIRRFLYDVGDQYACSREHHGRMHEKVGEVECANPADPGRTRFEDYEAARNGEDEPA